MAQVNPLGLKAPLLPVYSPEPALLQVLDDVLGAGEMSGIFLSSFVSLRPALAQASEASLNSGESPLLLEFGEGASGGKLSAVG